MFGIFWKFARIGERLSPYVSICCILMAVSIFVYSNVDCADFNVKVVGEAGTRVGIDGRRTTEGYVDKHLFSVHDGVMNSFVGHYLRAYQSQIDHGACVNAPAYRPLRQWANMRVNFAQAF